MLLLGYIPTKRLGGEPALVAMLAGGVVAMLASVAGTVPVLLARNRPRTDVVPAALGAMAVRLGVVAVLALAVGGSGLVALRPFILWVAIVHAGLMIPDAMFGIQVLAKQDHTEAR